jgi:hypothetical protein
MPGPYQNSQQQEMAFNMCELQSQASDTIRPDPEGTGLFRASQQIIEEVP